MNLLPLPLLFHFQNTIYGNGNRVTVKLWGRAFLEQDPDDQLIWINGVQPGGFAACGHSVTQASTAFKKMYVDILLDIADDAADFSSLEREVREFLLQTNESLVSDWRDAIANVGNFDICLAKRSVDIPPSLDVGLAIPNAADTNEIFVAA